MIVLPGDKSVRTTGLGETPRKGRWARASPIDLEAANYGRRRSTFASSNKKKIRGETKKVVLREEFEGIHKSGVPIHPDKAPVVLAFARLGTIIGTIFPAANNLDATVQSGIPSKKSGWDLLQFQFGETFFHYHGHLSNLVQAALGKTVENVTINLVNGQEDAPMHKVKFRGSPEINDTIALPFLGCTKNHSNVILLSEKTVRQSIDSLGKKVEVGRHPG